jgi:plasmid maintenance system antidote protein VapI
MMSETIFKFSTYKAIMNHRLRGEGQRGALSRAAEALNCQRSLLSRIMNSKLQLTPDQAFNLAKHWRLTSREREYFQTLVEFERAAEPSYREFLKARLLELRKEHASLGERAKRPAPTSAHEALYFSAWYWTAIHFLTSAPGYQTVTAIADHLGLSKVVVTDCLRRLKDWGFVREVGSKWEYAGGEFHLPKDSPLVILHHQNWRMRAVLDAQVTEGENIHYTNVQTISRSDLAALREKLLDFIEECNSMMRPSPPEEAVVLTFDLFSPG